MRAFATILMIELSAVTPCQAADTIPLVKGAGAFSQLLNELQADGKPVVIHFFATWCGECVTEMPRILQATESASKAGATVVFISLDAPADRQTKVAAFLRKHGVRAKTYLLDAPDSDSITALMDKKWDAGLPATFVFAGRKRTASFIGPIRDVSAVARAVIEARQGH
jgi:thiol-disulfide isomerase/thioredoxin